MAAGQGKRMRSDIPKVLHKVCGREIIGYVLCLALSLRPKQVIVVLGRGREQIMPWIRRGYPDKKVTFVTQHRLLGTADAIARARPRIKGRVSDVLVLYGDQPLLRKATLRQLLRLHYRQSAACTLFSAQMPSPQGYGRIIRDEQKGVSCIREDKDLNGKEKGINEVNAGSCIFRRKDLFAVLDKIRPNNKKGEYYLTDAISLLRLQGKKIACQRTDCYEEALGVNSRADLAEAENVLRKRIVHGLMRQGVTISGPETTFIDWDVRVGRDSVIMPFVYIGRGARIGRNCRIGPFCHIRGGSVIKDNAQIGSFAEINRSIVGEKTRIKHFSYLGDARLGKEVNIGAGTVTANFDGRNKNKTCIKDKAFIGSDTVLVAPLKVGRGAVTGAGCVITKNNDVPDNGVVWGVPARQKTKKG